MAGANVQRIFPSDRRPPLGGQLTLMAGALLAALLAAVACAGAGASEKSRQPMNRTPAALSGQQGAETVSAWPTLTARLAAVGEPMDSSSSSECVGGEGIYLPKVRPEQLQSWREGAIREFRSIGSRLLAAHAEGGPPDVEAVLQLVVASPSSPEDPPVWLVETYVPGTDSLPWRAVLWPAGGVLHCQIWGVGDNWFSAAWTGTSDSSYELVLQASSWSSIGSRSTFLLLRLNQAGTRWELVWKPTDWWGSDLDNPQGPFRWPVANATIILEGEQISTLFVRGTMFGLEKCEDDCLFYESTPTHHARFGARWARVGDEFVFGSAKVLPEPYVSVVRLSRLLRDGRYEEAREWVTRPEVLSQALSLGWDRRRPRCRWVAAPRLSDPAALRIFALDQGALFDIRAWQVDDEWLIDEIEPVVELSATGDPCPASVDRPAARERVPFTTYEGTHSGGGRFKFTVRDDGSRWTFDFEDTGCGGRTTISADNVFEEGATFRFELPDGSLSIHGSFPTPDTAEGTLSERIAYDYPRTPARVEPGGAERALAEQEYDHVVSCDSGTLTWTATRTRTGP